MSEVLLTRIDNRLIHGQVATQWINEIGANALVVANDEVANDDFRKQLMNMAAPARAKVIYTTLADAKKAIEDAGDDARCMVIVENPDDALTLIDAGVPVEAVNIGNMHMAEGKRQVATTVAVDDRDVENFKKMQEKGVHLFVQRTPGIREEDLNKVLA